jgi:hypothetical protein
MAMPMLPRLMTTIVHSTQTLKPRCSAKIDQIRFRWATFLPVVSQKTASSGSQWSIHGSRRAALVRSGAGTVTVDSIV